MTRLYRVTLIDPNDGIMFKETYNAQRVIYCEDDLIKALEFGLVKRAVLLGSLAETPNDPRPK